MDYIAFFSRKHKSLKDTFEQPGHGRVIHTSHFQRLSVRVSDEGRCPLDTRNYAEFVRVAAAAVEEGSPPTPEWGPWEFNGAREYRELTPRPTLVTAAESPAGVLMRAAARAFPELYGDDELTPFRVWSQWFFTTGNGLAWREDGTLDAREGTTDLGVRLRDARALLATAPSEEDLAKLDKFAQRMASADTRAFPQPGVSLYPSSRQYATIFKVPQNVEPSFLSAALDCCRYFLSRPIWECCTRMPSALGRVGAGAAEQAGDVRAYMLAEGASQRSKVEDAYAELVCYTHGAQVRAVGFVGEAFAFKAELPPLWISAKPVRS
jgi:hypothetical protein